MDTLETKDQLDVARALAHAIVSVCKVENDTLLFSVADSVRDKVLASGFEIKRVVPRD